MTDAMTREGWLSGIIMGDKDDQLLEMYSTLDRIPRDALTREETVTWVAVNRRMEILTGGSNKSPLYEAMRCALNGWDVAT